MASGCMECRNWEENVYWSRKTVYFHQILSGRYDEQLVIPKKFADNLREKMAQTVALRGPGGHLWDVGLEADGNRLLMKHGWKKFSEDHGLEENDVLIFKYNGNSVFDVLMFEPGESSCEKTSCYFAKKCGHAECRCPLAPSNQRRNIEESLEHTIESSDPLSSGDELECRVRRPRSKRPRTRPPRIPPPLPSTNDPRGAKRKQNSSRAYPQELVSHRRQVTVDEIERAHQMARAALSGKSCCVVMFPSHVYKGFSLSIPTKWGRPILPAEGEVTLRINDKSWKAKCVNRGYRCGLGGVGWKKFVMDNLLEEFDVCVFDVASGTGGDFILEVKVFRVVEPAVPPSQVFRADHCMS